MTASFVGKKVKLTLKPNFTLDGIVTGQNEHGIFFKTDQQESYLNWDTIVTIRVVD